MWSPKTIFQRAGASDASKSEQLAETVPQTSTEVTPSPSRSAQHRIWMRETTAMIQQHYQEKLGARLSKPHCCELSYQNQKTWFSGKQRAELEAVTELVGEELAGKNPATVQEEPVQLFENAIERFEDIQQNGGY